jgi:acyl dehydratase
MNIIRGKSEKIELKNIQHQILNNQTDIMFLRIPSVNVGEIQNLSKLGYEYFQTDTLVYYIVDFDKHKPKDLRNDDLIFKKANISDKGVLGKMVIEIFKGYTNHYFSNQYISKDEILEGYTEWVINFIDDETKDVFIVYQNEIAIAFATCATVDEIAEGVLYGVMPNSAGGGIYSDIIRYTQNYYLQKGFSKMKVSTQVQNYAVQKVWSREGFYINESYATVHINSLLNYSIHEIKEYYLDVKEKHIENYANISKDFNVIHFDDEEAKKSGFKGKIAHGLLACGEISRIFGTDYPGKGTIFMNYKNIFLAPFYPDHRYKFVLTTPFLNSKGVYMCVVKVFDTNEKLVMISYNQLIKK